MATVTYAPLGGSPFTITSGVFLCSNTKNDGTGTQSHGIYLRLRQQKSLKFYRNASAVTFMGRAKPAQELGQYSFKGVDMTYSWPPNGTAIDGSAVTAATMEATVTNIVADLQAGQYLELQDAKGRHYYGTFVQDPTIADEVDQLSGWQTMSCSFVELG